MFINYLKQGIYRKYIDDLKRSQIQKRNANSLTVLFKVNILTVRKLLLESLSLRYPEGWRNSGVVQPLMSALVSEWREVNVPVGDPASEMLVSSSRSVWSLLNTVPYQDPAPDELCFR